MFLPSVETESSTIIVVKEGKLSYLLFHLGLNLFLHWLGLMVVHTQKKFMKNIRQYNCLFAFTSMGANIDRSVNDGRGPPIFKISGQVHHRIGSLLPADGSAPKFLQLYIYDTSNEVQNRINALCPDEMPTDPIDPTIVSSLIQMLDTHNPLAQKFRMARDRLEQHSDENFVIRIVGPQEGDPAQYNLPSTEQLAMLIVGDFSADSFK